MKGSPYTKFLNHEINKLRGSGIFHNILLRHQKQPCQTNEALAQITLQKTLFLFAVFVLGVLLSITILFIEKFVSPIIERNEVRHSLGVKFREASFNWVNSGQLKQQVIDSALRGDENQRHSRGYDSYHNVLHTLTQEEYEMFQRTKR